MLVCVQVCWWSRNKTYQDGLQVKKDHRLIYESWFVVHAETSAIHKFLAAPFEGNVHWSHSCLYTFLCTPSMCFRILGKPVPSIRRSACLEDTNELNKGRDKLDHIRHSPFRSVDCWSVGWLPPGARVRWRGAMLQPLCSTRKTLRLGSPENEWSRCGEEVNCTE